MAKIFKRIRLLSLLPIYARPSCLSLSRLTTLTRKYSSTCFLAIRSKSRSQLWRFSPLTVTCPYLGTCIALAIILIWSLRSQRYSLSVRQACSSRALIVAKQMSLSHWLVPIHITLSALWVTLLAHRLLWKSLQLSSKQLPLLDALQRALLFPVSPEYKSMRSQRQLWLYLYLLSRRTQTVAKSSLM